MNNNEPINKKLRVVYNLLCSTTDRNMEIWFCEEEFLDSITYNPDFEDVENYLIQHLNEHYWQCCDIEDEEFTELPDPINKRLEREAKFRIECSKFNL